MLKKLKQSLGLKTEYRIDEIAGGSRYYSYVKFWWFPFWQKLNTNAKSIEEAIRDIDRFKESPAKTVYHEMEK